MPSFVLNLHNKCKVAILLKCGSTGNRHQIYIYYEYVYYAIFQQRKEYT